MKFFLKIPDGFKKCLIGPGGTVCWKNFKKSCATHSPFNMTFRPIQDVHCVNRPWVDTSPWHFIPWIIHTCNTWYSHGTTCLSNTKPIISKQCDIMTPCLCTITIYVLLQAKHLADMLVSALCITYTVQGYCQRRRIIRIRHVVLTIPSNIWSILVCSKFLFPDSDKEI